MTNSGHALIVCDEPMLLRPYVEILKRDGQQVSTATTIAEAMAQLEVSRTSLDVVLFDHDLESPEQLDSGLEFAVEVVRIVPCVKLVIVSANISSSVIERAICSGVYAYVLKNRVLPTVLRAKVRNAVEEARRQRLSTLDEGQADRSLREVWQRVRSEANLWRKGLLIEELMLLLFKTTLGFGHVTTQLTNQLERIEIVVEKWMERAAMEGRRRASARGVQCLVVAM